MASPCSEFRNNRPNLSLPSCRVRAEQLSSAAHCCRRNTGSLPARFGEYGVNATPLLNWRRSSFFVLKSSLIALVRNCGIFAGQGLDFFSNHFQTGTNNFQTIPILIVGLSTSHPSCPVIFERDDLCDYPNPAIFLLPNCNNIPL